MHVRRPLLALAAASLLLTFTAVGCGSDDKKADTTTTTEAEAATTTTVTDTSAPEAPIDTEPTTTLSPDQFDAAIASFQSQLDAAGTDFCKIAAAANSLEIGTPGTPAQAEAAYKAYATVLTKVADALPANSGVDGAKLKSAADDILAEAEAAGFDPAKLSGPPESFSEPETAKAMAGVASAIETSCPPA